MPSEPTNNQQTPPDNDTRTNDSALVLSRANPDQPSPVPYTDDSPAEIPLTITNTSNEPVAAGELFVELSPPAHTTATITDANVFPDSPTAYEICTDIPAGETISLTITATSDGLTRPKWNGQLDIVLNHGMTIQDHTTVAIYG